MTKKVKERFIGLVSALMVSLISFLTYSYLGSFETKASSRSKFTLLDKKISLVLCYMDKRHCTKELMRLRLTK